MLILLFVCLEGRKRTNSRPDGHMWTAQRGRINNDNNNNVERLTCAIVVLYFLPFQCDHRASPRLVPSGLAGPVWDVDTS